jgi:hypothetical protein
VGHVCYRAELQMDSMLSHYVHVEVHLHVEPAANFRAVGLDVGFDVRMLRPKNDPLSSIVGKT